MSPLEKYLRGASALTAQALVQKLLGALTSIILARGLGAAGFGTYTAVINTANSAFGLARLGIDAAIHVYAARGRDNEEAHRLTGELLGAGLAILSTAGFVVALATIASTEWLAAAVFGQPDLEKPLTIAGVLVALQCLSQFGYAVIVGLQHFGVYAKLMIQNAALTLALSTAGMWFYGVVGAIVGYGVGQTVLTVLLGGAAVRAMREHSIPLAFRRLRPATRSLMRLGLPFYASGLLAIPVTFYLQGLLSRSAGIDALGILRVIATITALIAFIPMSVAAATTSELTKKRTTSDGSSSSVFDYAFLHLKIVWYLTTVMAVALASFAPMLIKALFGLEYTAAIEPSTVALFSTVLSTTAAATGSLFFAMERSGVIFWQIALQSLVLTFAGVIAIPSMGVLGYVGAELLGNLVALVFVLVIAFRVSNRDWRNSEHTRAFILYALGGAFSSFLTYGILSPSVRLPALIVLVLVLTFGIVRFGLNAWEQSVLLRIPSAFRAAK